MRVKVEKGVPRVPGLINSHKLYYKGKINLFYAILEAYTLLTDSITIHFQLVN